MAYNDQVSRSDAAALIPEDVTREIVKGVIEKSAALTYFKHRNMGRAQQRMPVLASKPTAFFVNGDTGQKQTTDVTWANKYLDAEEVAAIVPIPEKVLDDSDYDIWAEIKPELEEAFAVTIDGAIFFGTNKPSSWPSDILTAAIAAGNVVTAGTSAIDVADDINNVMGTIEADGYEVNGFFGRAQMKATLRGLRDTQHQPIFQQNLGGIEGLMVGDRLYNEPIKFSRAGLTGFAAGTGNASLFAGDWTQGIIGMRQDMTYKMLDQAVITDGSGVIQFNLPQQDMVALRAVMRLAWQVPNPLNRMNTNSTTRYPFGALRQA